MNTVNVIVVVNNTVDKIISFPDDEKGNKDAEMAFLNECANRLTNWNEYTQNDLDTIIENGIENFGNGSINITHSE